MFNSLLKSIDSIEGLVDTTYNMNAMTMLNEHRVKAFLYRVLKSVCDEWLLLSREKGSHTIYNSWCM